VLDLRDNGGGLLNEAVSTASVFIPDGRIGVINGNEFTPLNMPPVSGTVMYLALGAQAGAW